MPSNQTTNYGLSQWVKSDQVKMEDFNADNAKIDAAIKAEADTRAAETAALNAALNKKGNCRVVTMNYIGDGLFGRKNPKTLTFDSKPMALFIYGFNSSMIYMLRGWSTAILNEGNSIYVSWGDDSVSWSSDTNAIRHLNQEGASYCVVAFLAVD